MRANGKTLSRLETILLLAFSISSCVLYIGRGSVISPLLRATSFSAVEIIPPKGFPLHAVRDLQLAYFNPVSLDNFRHPSSESIFSVKRREVGTPRNDPKEIGFFFPHRSSNFGHSKLSSLHFFGSQYRMNGDRRVGKQQQQTSPRLQQRSPSPID